MDTLFTEMENERKSEVAPLAVRMRPRTLEEVVGQDEAVGPGSWLRNAIEQDQLSSVILFGPAGTGKTSLAHVIAETTKATFVEVSAIGGTVSDLRREIDAADKRLSAFGLRTILFVDEIHRFNRSQQDALLHAVEDRVLVLVGATTENPFFEVNSALISRSRVVELHGLSDEEIVSLVERALADERGLGGRYRLDATGARRSPRWSLPPVWCSPAPRRSPRRSPRTTCARPRRIARCPTTRTRTCTTTSSRRSSSPCAAATPMPRCTGSPA